MSHKYIRKYQKGGQWVYVYHEASRTRRMKDSEVTELKTKAEQGHEESKQLHDSIKDFTPEEVEAYHAKKEAKKAKLAANKQAKVDAATPAQTDEKPEAPAEPEKTQATDEESAANYEKLKSGFKQEAPKKVTTPREKAKAQKKDKEYINARESAFANIGEDVQGAARHKRTLSIQQLRDDPTAPIKLKDLLDNEPVSFIDNVEPNNPINPYLCQKMIDRFPKECTPGKKNPERDRKAYLDAFEKIKELSQKHSKPDSGGLSYKDILQEAQKEIVNIIKGARADGSSADFLVRYVNSTLGMRPVKGSVTNDLTDYSRAVKSSGKGDLADFLKSEDGMKITKDLMEGKSFKDAFNIETGGDGKKERFNIGKFYDGSVERKGPSTGLSSPEKQTSFLTKDCELRSIQWGNSVTDDEREHHLKCSAEAFKDLADVTGLPDKMISYNGKLALAIGARGKGSALAHYESDEMIINLTRNSGVGSLAHEWGHFFDNIIAKSHGIKAHQDNTFMSEAANFNIGEDSEVKQSMGKLIKSEVWSDYKKLTRDSITEMNSNGFAVGKPSYWLSPREMFARAFETYVDYKLMKGGKKNTYLSGGNRGLFWPTDEMMEKMTPLMDEFIETFKKSDYMEKSMKLLVNGKELKPIHK